MSAKVRVALGAFAALLLLSATARANQAAAYKKYKGQIVVAAQAIPQDFTVADLKRLGTTALPSGPGGGWPMYFVGFMKKKPGTSPIHIVFYDVTKGRREYVSNKEINIDPNSNILLSDVTLSEDDGLQKNHKYDVLLAVMVRGKEIIFAKTRLTLK